MEMLKGRTIEKGQKVFVYKNLHKGCWSVKDVKSGLVLAHCEEIELENATFKVSEAGRQRVLREGRKNVHAGVVGYYTGNSFELQDIMKGMNMVTYNPHKFDSFRVKFLEQQKVESSPVVRMTSTAVFAKLY
jgi:hypothetical protein